jgi:mRNA-degrading endonuclease RelE of RelBE toxin-antitoxin system
MYKIYYSDHFKKNIKKFDLARQKLIFAKIEFLRNDPDHPSLRTEKLDGERWASSVSMGIRLIWELYRDTINVIDVGKHDIYRQY